MNRNRKIRIIKISVLSWLVLASCKVPDFVSGMGDAIKNMFQSLARGIGF